MICHSPLQLRSYTGVNYYYQSRYTTAACAELWDHLNNYVLKAALLFTLPLCNCSTMTLPQLWALEIKAVRGKVIFTKGTKWHTLERGKSNACFSLVWFHRCVQVTGLFLGDPSLPTYYYLLKWATATFQTNQQL